MKTGIAPAKPPGSAVRKPVAPSSAPAASPTSDIPSIEALDDFERAIADAEYDIAPPAPAAPALPPRNTVVTGANTGSAIASPIVGYAGSRRRSAVEDEGAQAARVHDQYAPIALIIAGVALAFVDAYLLGIHNPAVAALYVTIVSVLNLVLVFVALLAGVKLIDLGLGPVGTAMLKIAAVAILPAALSGIIGHWTMGLMSWSISAVCYYILLFYLFEMDSREMMIITTIIWGIRFFMNIFLVVVVMRMLGAAIPSGASGLSGVAGHGGESVVIGDSSDESGGSHGASPASTDAEAVKEIQSGNAVEAREWLKPEQKGHAGFKMGKQAMLALAERFYAAGAVKVWCAGMETIGQAQVCAQFLVELPYDRAARRGIRKIVDELNEAETPTPDDGGRYLSVSLD